MKLFERIQELVEDKDSLVCVLIGKFSMIQLGFSCSEDISSVSSSSSRRG